MISLVVPTYNRAYTLKQVIDTFYQQADVNEIIIIDDAGVDETGILVKEFAARHKTRIHTVYLRNDERKGAAYSRMKGVRVALNEYILFCDDDNFLGPHYARTCRRKIDELGASIVSGRHFYRLPGELLEDAIKRFGSGLRRQRPFDTLCFRVNTQALFAGDFEIPFTHGIFLTRKSLLMRYELDAFYSKGNGFREESDVQVRAFLDGHRVLVTNDAHAIHLHNSEVKSGGQRVQRLQRYYWTVYYTRYFYKKYFRGMKARLNIPYSAGVAITLFAVVEFYMFFVRPVFLLPGRLLQRWRQ